MVNQGKVLRISQEREMPVSEVQSGKWYYRYAYWRAMDLRINQQAGQDYLTLRESPEVLAFALCDGVSQSFYGDLAARFLGEALLSWLWEELAPTIDAAPFQQALAGRLRAWIAPATEQVRQHPLPDGLPPLVRDVLEEKRALGSQTTFICGRIDLPTANFPHGRLCLAWMGDSRLRLRDAAAERTPELGSQPDTSQRWSTRQGPVGGEPHVFVAPLSHGSGAFSSLTAYSDGLSAIDHLGLTLSNEGLQQAIARCTEAPTSDDIAFLEIRWMAEPVAIAPLSLAKEFVPSLQPTLQPVATPVERPTVTQPVLAAPVAKYGSTPRRLIVIAAAISVIAMVIIGGIYAMGRIPDRKAPRPRAPLNSTIRPPAMAVSPTVRPTLALTPTSIAPPMFAPSLTPAMIASLTITPTATASATLSLSVTVTPKRALSPTSAPKPNPEERSTTPSPSKYLTPLATTLPKFTPIRTPSMTSAKMGANTPQGVGIRDILSRRSAWTARLGQPSS